MFAPVTPPDWCTRNDCTEDRCYFLDSGNGTDHMIDVYKIYIYIYIYIYMYISRYTYVRIYIYSVFIRVRTYIYTSTYIMPYSLYFI